MFANREPEVASYPNNRNMHQDACGNENSVFKEEEKIQRVSSPVVDGKTGESSSKVFTLNDDWSHQLPPAGDDRVNTNVLIEWMEVEVKNRLVVINEKLEKLVADYDIESREERKGFRGSIWSSGNGEIVVPEGMSEAGLAVVQRVSQRSVISAAPGVISSIPDLNQVKGSEPDDSQSPKTRISGAISQGLIEPPPRPSNRPSQLSFMRPSQNTLSAFSINHISARASSLVQAVLSNKTRSSGQQIDRIESTDGEYSEALPQGAPYATRGRSMVDRMFGQVGNLLDKEEGTLTLCDRLWHFLEDPESGFSARIYHTSMTFFICATVFWSLLQSMNPPPLARERAVVWEISFDCVFAIEFILRFASCPAKCHFFLGTYNIIDLAVAALLIFRCIIGFDVNDEDSLTVDLLLTLTPALRLMKTLRRFQKFHLIFSAFESALEALPVLLWTLLLTTLMFSALIFLVEPRDNIGSLPQAMWLTIVTMTTVGYGDVTPKSATGSMFTAVLIVSSVLYMAMPLAIIGQSFSTIWGERDRILLMQQTRKRLLQWGYTAQDIPVLFSLFDGDGSGELELPEFRSMIKAMRIGLKEERVVQLFESFDMDGSGAIDDREFVRFIFPSSYSALYDKLGRTSHSAGAGERGSMMRASKTSRNSKASRASTMSRRARPVRRRDPSEIVDRCYSDGERSIESSQGMALDIGMALKGDLVGRRRVSRQSLLLPAGAPPTLPANQDAEPSLSIVVPGSVR